MVLHLHATDVVTACAQACVVVRARGELVTNKRTEATCPECLASEP